MPTEVIDVVSDDDDAPSTTTRPLPPMRPSGSGLKRHVDPSESRKVGRSQSSAVDLTKSPPRHESNVAQQDASVDGPGIAEASDHFGAKRPLDPSHQASRPVAKRVRSTVSSSGSTTLPAPVSKPPDHSLHETVDLTLDEEPLSVKGSIPKPSAAFQPQIQLSSHRGRDQPRRHEDASQFLDASPSRLLANTTNNVAQTSAVAKSPSRKPLSDARVLNPINTGQPKAHELQKPKNNVTAPKSLARIPKSNAHDEILAPLVQQLWRSVEVNQPFSQRRCSRVEDTESRSTIPESPPISPTGFHEQRCTLVRAASSSRPRTDHDQPASTAAKTHVKPVSESNSGEKSRSATSAMEARGYTELGRILQPPAMNQKVGDRRELESSVVSYVPEGSGLLKASGKDRYLAGNAAAEKASRPFSSFEARPNSSAKPPVSTTKINGEDRAGDISETLVAPTLKKELGPTAAEAYLAKDESPRKDRCPSRKVAAMSNIAIPSQPRLQFDDGHRPLRPETMKKASIEAEMVHDNLKDVERIVGQYIAEMREDNEYVARVQLRRARHAGKRRDAQHSTPPTSAFRDLTPISLSPPKSARMKTDHTAKFSVEQFPGSKNAARATYSMRCSVYRSSAKDMPPYSHYVGLKHSLLASNETTLHVWPYFHDDFDMMRDAPDLHKAYRIDVEDRERKLLRLGQAEGFMEYADDMLSRIGCQWADVLRFLLEQNPCPTVAENPAYVRALVERNKYMEHLRPNAEHCAHVLSNLPPSRPGEILKAALLCDQFQRIAKYPLWHVARRIPYVQNLARSLEAEDADLSKDIDKFTCRVCTRVNCSWHGEIRETPFDEHHRSEDDNVDGDPNVNFRYRVPMPASIDTTVSEVSLANRKTVEYWQRGPIALLAKNMNPDQHGPFYPCYHPGASCNQANCSCFKLKLPCEKICACSIDCARKFLGCQCSSERTRKGQKLVCYEDDRCACFQLGRECDPDLCGDCGVCDVLDPVHHGDDRILQGRCNNASIQRGVTKHTLLGDSGIHGLGLYACEDIVKHDFVGEYTGEIVTRTEADRRGAVHKHQKLSYLFTLNTEQDIDGTTFGSKMRFINHAARKKSNLYPRIVLVNSVHRIALYGQRRIKAGEELFFDYGPEFGEEALGGSSNDVVAAKEKKAAPKTRNSLLVNTFVAVDRKRDSVGNLVAMPSTSKGSDGEDEYVDEEGDRPEDGEDFDMDEEDMWNDTLADPSGLSLKVNNDEEFNPGDESSEVRDSDDTIDNVDSAGKMYVRERPRRQIRQTARGI